LYYLSESLILFFSQDTLLLLLPHEC
jgi:hypothetical protein